MLLKDTINDGKTMHIYVQKCSRIVVLKSLMLFTSLDCMRVQQYITQNTITTI